MKGKALFNATTISKIQPSILWKEVSSASHFRKDRQLRPFELFQWKTILSSSVRNLQTCKFFLFEIQFLKMIFPKFHHETPLIQFKLEYEIIINLAVNQKLNDELKDAINCLKLNRDLDHASFLVLQ
ncbi:CLUMA_CG006627, isoform A [Clunio marinus]|uniref:CLUMA_CG006627, isoform A n=1 Tax=Clunio marinus TaxID=568069 RepID=A0A1J1I061_9DIPT|nr:CLUMA_CG006627, isoform A [Clunio marinus]